MGDTFRDPVGHLRDTRPFVGELLIDVVHRPGYFLVVAGVIGGVGSLAAFGTGHHSQGATSGIAAAIVAVIGASSLTVEHARIRRIADRWYAGNPEVQHQRLAG